MESRRKVKSCDREDGKIVEQILSFSIVDEEGIRLSGITYSRLLAYLCEHLGKGKIRTHPRRKRQTEHPSCKTRVSGLFRSEMSRI